jgi:putative Mg2+ transporter-C (MgtC) family protein
VLLASSSGDPTKISDAASRVMQGILTGIGFLGAGVIVHRQDRIRVHGLTSAACTWLAACIGIACGIGQWRTVAVALAITLVLLVAGHKLERRLHRALGGRDDSQRSASLPPADAPPR